MSDERTDVSQLYAAISSLALSLSGIENDLYIHL